MSGNFHTTRLFYWKPDRVTILFAVFTFVFCLTAVRSIITANLVVINTLDSGTGSLRAAVATAGGNGQPDTITFDIPAGEAGCTDLTCTIALRSQITPLSNGDNELTISGTGANVIILSGNNATRVLKINSGVVINVNNLTITNGNSGSGEGGGITNSGILTLTRTTISNNTSNGGGGGISNTAGAVTLINSTVSGNTASFDGGISSFGGLTLVNVTVTNNTMTGGNTNPIFSGGVNNRSGSATVQNTLIAGNRSGSISTDVKGTFVSHGYNLIGNPETSSGFSAANNDILNPPGGAMLAPLGNNGGSTPTHGLLFGSAAINAGNNALAVDPADGNKILTTDQRGIARIIGSSVDIGSFEFVPVKSRKKIRFL